MMDNQYVKGVLLKSGWIANRLIDPKVIIEKISNEGYQSFPAVINFLQNVWDLVIYFENKQNGIRNDEISFRFENATHLEVPERVHGEYTRRIGKKLCLIGTVYREYMILLMAEDGYMYGAYDSYLCEIANSGMEAIKAILLDFKFKEIE